jgi:valyl-tRNA synthetase
VNEKPEGAFVFVIRNTEFYIPVGDKIDVEEEIKKMTEELNYKKGFLQSVQKKMSNESFVKNAPAVVVDAEKKKMADAEAKMQVLESQISMLKK